MGLELLLEAVRFLEYQENKTEVDARGADEKGLPDLPSNRKSSAAVPTPIVNHGRASPDEVVYLCSVINDHANISANPIKTPEPENGFKISAQHLQNKIHQLTQSSAPNVNFVRETNQIASDSNKTKPRTTQMHSEEERNRRVRIKERFQLLKGQLLSLKDAVKVSQVAILETSLRLIQTLKRKEREYEQEKDRLTRAKFDLLQKLYGKSDQEQDREDMLPKDSDMEIDEHNNGTEFNSFSLDTLENHASSILAPNSSSTAIEPPKQPDIIGNKIPSRKLFLHGKGVKVKRISNRDPVNLVTRAVEPRSYPPASRGNQC